MLRFFRSSSSMVIAVVLLLGGLVWLHAFMDANLQVTNNHSAFLFQTVSGWMNGIPNLAAGIGLGLIMVETIMLVIVNNKLHLIDKISYLPALCHVLLIGSIPAIHGFNPVIIAVILLTVAFIHLIESFSTEKLSYCYFTAPVFISFAAFFCQYAYVYMLAVWCALLFMRPGYWREWVFSVLGFLLPVFFVFCWFFLVEDDPARLIIFFKEAFFFQRILPGLTPYTVIFPGIGILSCLVALRYSIHHLGSKKIVTRNGYYLLLLIAIVTLALPVVVPSSIPLIWYLMAFPLSFILSYYLATVKSAVTGTIILSVLFVNMIMAQAVYFVHSFL